MQGNSSSDGVLDRLRDGARRLSIAESTANVVYWDERISLQHPGSAWRAEQRAWLGDLVQGEHEAVNIGALVDAVEQRHPGHPEAVAVARAAEHSRSLDAVGRAEVARRASQAMSARSVSLDANDATGAITSLQPVLELARQRAAIHRPDLDPYDSLLDLHEPGMTGDRFAALVEPIVAASQRLIAAHAADALDPSGDVTLDTELSVDAAHAVEQVALDATGLDSGEGLVAWSERAFCSVLGPRDVRLASRFNESRKLRIVLSTLHEAGHAAYARAWSERGLPHTLAGIASVGVDESASRIFESHVGASRGFWDRIANVLRDHGLHPDPQLLTLQSRLVLPGVRRLGSDEVTYPLHIALRFELERDLVNGALELGDLEAAWNAKVEQYLGVPVSNPREGVLQDVHWWLGQLGYFPCYLLGEIYAAQFRAAAQCSDDAMDAALTAGAPPPWIAWLSDNVWSRGCELAGTDLVEELCGEIASDPFIAHLERRVAPLEA